MDGLDELAALNSAPAQNSRRVSTARPTPAPNPILTGLLMAIGAAPILFAVLILAFMTCEQILKGEVQNAMDDARAKMQQQIPNKNDSGNIFDSR